MNPEEKIGVALVKEACPLCGKLVDGPIIMNTRLSPVYAKKVKELHGKTVGYMEGPCNECKDLMSKGFLLIGVVDEKTDDKKNPYRSGYQWVITNEAAEKIFKDTEKGAAFIDMKLAVKIGLENG